MDQTTPIIMDDIEEVLRSLKKKYPLVRYTGAGVLYSSVRRMKAERELGIPINRRTGFAISLKYGKAANELDESKSKRSKQKAQEKVNKYSAMHESISATQAGESGIPGQIRLREKIAEVYSALGGYEGAPSNLQIKALDLYQGDIDTLRNVLK
jgi:hypothetical protein